MRDPFKSPAIYIKNYPSNPVYYEENGNAPGYVYSPSHRNMTSTSSSFWLVPTEYVGPYNHGGLNSRIKYPLPYGK